MDNTYLTYTWWFEKSWDFRVREPHKKAKKSKSISLGVPQALECAEEYEHGDFKGPVLTVHLADGTIYVLALSNVLLNPVRGPSDHNPLWRRLYGKGLPAGKSPIEVAGIVLQIYKTCVRNVGDRVQQPRFNPTRAIPATRGCCRRAFSTKSSVVYISGG